MATDPAVEMFVIEMAPKCGSSEKYSEVGISTVGIRSLSRPVLFAANRTVFIKPDPKSDWSCVVK